MRCEKSGRPLASMISSAPESSGEGMLSRSEMRLVLVVTMPGLLGVAPCDPSSTSLAPAGSPRNEIPSTWWSSCTDFLARYAFRISTNASSPSPFTTTSTCGHSAKTRSA
jgi:hypothetical protein